LALSGAGDEAKPVFWAFLQNWGQSSCAIEPVLRVPRMSKGSKTKAIKQAALGLFFAFIEYKNNVFAYKIIHKS
jgi:hypothetical protein